MNLFSRNSDLPGRHGTLRDCTPGAKGLKKLSAGDFAVVNAPDITRQEAQALVDAKPGAVLNLAQFTTGAVPNYGPQLLLDADVVLVEDLGDEFGAVFRDGKKVRITEDGEVLVGEKHLGSGTPVLRADAENNFAAAQRGLIDHMEAYFGNSIEFIHSEGPLLIDGLGIPDAGIELAGRKVVIVAPSDDHRTKIKLLRNFIREYEPVLIAVNEAANDLDDMGYAPDIIVANPHHVEAETLRKATKVIVPAGTDGQVAGIERIQDLGVGAMTFPAAVESTSDLALLLASFHQADLIVQVGGAVDLDDVLMARPQATPAAVLTRLKAGRKLVDVDSVISLYTAPSGNAMAWLWALLGVLVALAAVILVAGLGGDGAFNENLLAVWNKLTALVVGWIH